jgi:outer membrane receptor for ferrienterochelin and colicin
VEYSFSLHSKNSIFMLKRLSLLLSCTLLIAQILFAQTTTSSITGFVTATNNEPLVGATITALHVPTGTTYRTQTKAGGKFDISNMNPGGPYTISVSYVNFETVTRQDIYLTLGESSKQDFNLANRAAELTTVVVSANRGAQKQGVESSITRDRIQNLPTVGRNITDLLKSVPQAKLASTEGSISIAGQNNRYNAFYVDGALNNDVFGLAASGTNGGQANVPPISLDAIDQISVVISPYDASLSGFTGGGINAITRSGTNNFSGSVYYLFRNQELAGKTPTGDKSNAVKLPDFTNKTYGFRIGGPIIKNKLFFFLNGEIQDDIRPQLFDTANYRGNTRPWQALQLAETLKTQFGYDPGGFINNPEKVYGKRGVAKIDWNINEKHKFTFSYRYNSNERNNTTASNSSAINFFNNGYVFPNTSHTFTGELRSQFRKSLSNRLLVTFTDVEDNRDPLGAAFPRVQIFDNTGTGSSNGIIFGPDFSSTVNYLKQQNLNIQDQFRVTLGKHSLSFGPDVEWAKAYNSFIQRAFGFYQYANLDSFLQNRRPNQYAVGYSLVDQKDASEKSLKAAADFATLRAAFFVNDEIRPSQNLTLNLGIRVDKFMFIDTPAEDTFTNKYALPVFAQYYDLQGARSGLKPKFPLAVSPRIGLTYRIPDENLTIRFGTGIFTGRIPLVWPGGIFNNNGLYVGGFTANYSATGSAANNAAINKLNQLGGFRANPFNQYTASDLGLGITKGPLNLISETFKLPQVWRTSLGFDKQLGKGWTATLEGFYTKNTQEIYYTNIGIQPPIGTSVGPGSRNVYPASANVVINGSNSVYDNAILISNAKGDKGYSYNITAGIDKRFTRGFSMSVNYSYGDAVVVHEPTSSVNLSQWRFMETVNGRNYIGRSTSDFSPGHRIFAYLSKQFTYANKALATTVTLTYTGQSGSPISYVYSGAPVRDDPSGGNDLIYVPTASELQAQTFVNNTLNINGVSTTFTPQQQKDALEAYIQNNKYLSSRRGQFAERNGDRLPFQHIIDLSLKQDFNVKVGGKRVQFQITYDMFNFTNFLNRNWGRTYFMTNDQLAVIGFAGYVSATNLTPQYRFNPTLAQAQSENNISTSAAPSFSPRWISQLGFRINF